MQYNQDLNSNLIKSLTSVHLPPPPSSHMNQQFSIHQQTQAQVQQQHYQNAQVQAQAQLGASFMAVPNEMMFHERIPLGISPDMNITAFEVQQNSLKPPTTRRSLTTDELSLPLTTPPHTVARYETRPAKTSGRKIDDTPTLNAGRAKKAAAAAAAAQNPLSPQYSSPSSVNLSSDPVVPSSKKASKPPQPSFVSKSKANAASQPDEPFVIPEPEQMPVVIHESDTKPPYSYATLIGMAILRGEDRKLTLSQIYSWISSTFKYYRRNDVGWQNSIRHNLSLNKAFIKTEKSSDGKGHYWEIVKGHEIQFVRGKNGKKALNNIQFETAKPNVPKPEKLQEPVQTKPVTNKRLSSDTKSFKINNGALSGKDDSEFESADEDDSETDDVSKTPKSQIRSLEPDNDDRPSLKKSHTAIGLQRFTLPRAKHMLESDDDDEYSENDQDSTVPKKKLQTKPVSLGAGSLKNIPSLQAPDTTWAASAGGERVIFGQTKPEINIESPKNSIELPLPYTSSFSCNTNFELSPLKRQETGPLLEPLTPSSRLTSFNTTASVTTAPTSVSNSQQSLPQSHSSHVHFNNNNNNTNLNSITPATNNNNTHQSLPSLASTVAKTPLRSTTNNHSGLTNSGIVGSAQTNHFYNFIKTPTAKLRTPNSNSIMRKFWNSPSFIDDFYTSPSIPRNSDDDYHKSFYGSPNKKSNDKKNAYYENSGTFGFSDLFGVDICSVVKRAVESVNEKPEDQQDKHSLSTVEQNGSTTDDDDFESNTTV